MSNLTAAQENIIHQLYFLGKRAAEFDLDKDAATIFGAIREIQTNANRQYQERRAA